MTKLILILSLLFSLSIFAEDGSLSNEQNQLDDEIASILDQEDNVTSEELADLDDGLDDKIDRIEL